VGKSLPDRLSVAIDREAVKANDFKHFRPSVVADSRNRRCGLQSAKNSEYYVPAHA
jgi:hypothetical protein